jgi:hypothetical protein
MSDGRGSPSVNVEGMVEGFSGVIFWSPANLTFAVEDKTSRFGMVGCEWRVIRYATTAILASFQGKVRLRSAIIATAREI